MLAPVAGERQAVTPTSPQVARHSRAQVPGVPTTLRAMVEGAGTWAAAVGSVQGGTPVAEVVAGLLEAMTPDEKLWCLDGDLPFWAGLGDLGEGGYHKRTFPAARVERLGIPGFAFSDGPRGVVIGPATCFPVSMARGAAWDLELEERIGDAIGTELRSVGADLFGGVCVNVLRHPAWGRAQETYGEDPFHVGELGAALVRGVQRHAMACVKHLACNSMENARFEVDVAVDEVALHEVFLPQFRRIVDEGVAVVMTAYNALNGEWCGQNRPLLTQILRDEWGFSGFAISDWIFGLRDAGLSLTAGLDVEMPYQMVRAGGLDAALADGATSWEDVDRSVAHVLATLLRFSGVLDAERPGSDVLASPAHRALAREAAAKSVVLLRNEPVDGVPVLPLDPARLQRVALLGALADIRNLGDGGSSDVWAESVVTPAAGLRLALGGVELTLDDGTDATRAGVVAADADVAVVVVGYTKDDEGEFIGAGGTNTALQALMPGPDDPDLAARFTDSVAANPGPEPPAGLAAAGPLTFSTGGDRSSLRLHRSDEDLIAAVVAANPRTVVVLVAGSAVLTPWADDVPAVLQGFYGGMEGGHGLADVLVGRRSPGGRLPFSVPTDEAHLPPFDHKATVCTYDRWHGWWKLERDGHPARFPFGWGLTYSGFEWGEFSANVADGVLEVTGSVTNTGGHTAAEVVQVYGAAASFPDQPRRLVGFARLEVAPGAGAEVTIRVPLSLLAARDAAAARWVLPQGRVDLEMARHVGDPRSQRVTVEVPD